MMRHRQWVLVQVSLLQMLSACSTQQAGDDAAMDGSSWVRKVVLAVVVLLTLLGVVGCAGLIGQSPMHESSDAKVYGTATTPPFAAKVVGLQWLNPLQRMDYSTEWQLLWTLGLTKPNTNDDMVRVDPKMFTKLGFVASIAYADNGRASLGHYFGQYMTRLLSTYRSRYYTDKNYFYTVASDDERQWRELAGIRVEMAIPPRLETAAIHEFVLDDLIGMFSLGLPGLKNVWSKDIPPDIRITVGGGNAGFAALTAALDYLQAHPKETVWVASWDAPSYPSKTYQINENMVLLILSGPQLETEREALAWISYPSSSVTAGEEAKAGESRAVKAWRRVFGDASSRAGKDASDIGYTIHDAGQGSEAASERIAPLAQALTTSLTEFDFAKQTFNTSAVLGDMGTGGALTNVALAIGYANHVGKTVLVAGTTDPEHPTAVVVVPPAKVRPIDPNKPWFRARGEGTAYLPWWGLRRDAAPSDNQGYSR